MKRIQSLLLIALTVAAISSGRAEGNEAAKKDLAKLQGEWSLVSGITDGYPIPDTMLSNSKRICKGDELTAIVGGQLIMKARITLAPSKEPKAIDYDGSAGLNNGKKLLGIYQLDGDTFKSCFGAPGAERPKDFASKPGAKRTSTVWKRVKAAAKPEQK